MFCFALRSGGYPISKGLLAQKQNGLPNLLLLLLLHLIQFGFIQPLQNLRNQASWTFPLECGNIGELLQEVFGRHCRYMKYPSIHISLHHDKKPHFFP